MKGTEGDNNWSDLMESFENDYAFDLKIQAGNLTFGTNFMQKTTSNATYIKSTGTIYKDYGTLWNIRFINNYLKYNFKISDQVNLTSTLYNRNATVLDNTVVYVVDTAQIGYYRPNNLTGLESVISYNNGSFFSITGGVTFEYEQLAQKFSVSISSSPTVKPPAPEAPKMDNNFLASVFIEPRLTLFKNLFLSAGLRFDNSNVYDQVLTPRAGICYNFNKNIIRFSYSEAFRAPKPWDYSDGLGNGSLLPERMKSFEVALTIPISSRFKVDFIGYKNTLANAISKEILSNGYRWGNEGEVNTDGIEIDASYSSRHFLSSLNYTFNQSYNINHILCLKLASIVLMQA